jgi:GNAT superfamily N-acetyltransferase
VDLHDAMLRWQRGWAASRDLPRPESIAGGWRIRCEQPSRDVEFFALDADVDVGSLLPVAAKVRDEDPDDVVWLTVLTARPELVGAALVSAGLTILYPSDALMTIELADQAPYPPAAPYRLVVGVKGLSTIADVYRDADLAAHGQAGLAGADAVPDRIETKPAHRRRGLGSVVMSALAQSATARGARHGLLIASADGQHLYRRLGWRHVASVVVART